MPASAALDRAAVACELARHRTQRHPRRPELARSLHNGTLILDSYQTALRIPHEAERHGP
jgi:hypothetical protein